MLNRSDAIAELVEEKLPLFTSEIRRALADINQGPPNPSVPAVLEVIKRYPDHFADYIRYKTDDHNVTGEVVWTCPETGHDFHDIDVEVVCRYLEAAYAIEDRLSRMSRPVLLRKIERLVEAKRKRDIELGKIEDEERYFSLPAAYASDECWLHWSGLPYLTADECAALAMGLDPSLVSLSKVESAVGKGKSAFLENFRKTTRMFERDGGKKGPDSANISFQRFKELINKHAIRPSSPAMAFALGIAAPSDVDVRHVSTPAVHSLYRIVIALALKQYPELAKQVDAAAYKNTPKRTEKSVYNQMERDLKQIISTISDNLLRKYLERAYSYARSEKLIAAPKETKT